MSDNEKEIKVLCCLKWFLCSLFMIPIDTAILFLALFQKFLITGIS